MLIKSQTAQRKQHNTSHHQHSIRHYSRRPQRRQTRHPATHDSDDTSAFQQRTRTTTQSSNNDEPLNIDNTTTNNKSSKPKPPVNPHEEHIVDIVDLSSEGYGVSKVDGFPMFIPNALPAERVKVRVDVVKKTYAHATVLNTLTTSPDRQDPPCEFFKDCGGCQLQHFEYAAQLKFKQHMVESVLQRIGKLNPDVVVKPILGMTSTEGNPWRYRNKSQIPVNAACSSPPPPQRHHYQQQHQRNSRNGINMGFYEPRSHTITNITDCMISSPDIAPILNEFKTFLQDHLHITGYDEATHSGTLRHIILRNGTVDDALMVILVTKTRELFGKDEIVAKLQSLFGTKRLQSVYHNINAERTNTILGVDGGMHLLYGNEVIYDELNGLRYAIGPHSFYQVNHAQTRVLYDKIRDYAALRGDEIVVDAYCGVGTIGLSLAKHCKRVYGVEIIPSAIEDAKANARLNGLENNCYFEAGRAEVVIPQWGQRKMLPNNRIDVLIVDPPRKGCDEALLKFIAEYKPKKVIYVSCNPATLARDLNVLEGSGVYKTKEVQPVDMFPHTHHVESIACLELVG